MDQEHTMLLSAEILSLTRMKLHNQNNKQNPKTVTQQYAIQKQRKIQQLKKPVETPVRASQRQLIISWKCFL